MATNEVEKIRNRYRRREEAGLERMYDALNPCNVYWHAESQIAIASLLASWWPHGVPFRNCRVLEVGCGAGSNLLDMIRLGVEPENILANDLLEARLARARERLPKGVTFLPGDGLELAITPESVDLALQFTVFSSILDKETIRALAQAIWGWLKPGGALLSYDLAYDNPRNRDVRKIALSELKALFPEATVIRRRVTLAPPIARHVAWLGRNAFFALSAVPLLRSHNLCLIVKPSRRIGP
jgi:SAM-dependent methyltransferase